MPRWLVIAPVGILGGLIAMAQSIYRFRGSAGGRDRDFLRVISAVFRLRSRPHALYIDHHLEEDGAGAE